MPGEDWKVIFSEEVQEVMAKDPEAAEFVRDTTARMRQAIHDFETGKVADLDEALRSIGMVKIADEGTSVDMMTNADFEAMVDPGDDEDDESNFEHDETKP